MRQSLATRNMQLIKVKKDLLSCEAFIQGSVDIGDIVKITLPRFGLDSGGFCSIGDRIRPLELIEWL